MAPYHYFYELYKQKLHYHSAMKVNHGFNRRKKRHIVVSSSSEQETLEGDQVETDVAVDCAILGSEGQLKA